MSLFSLLPSIRPVSFVKQTVLLFRVDMENHMGKVSGEKTLDCDSVVSPFPLYQHISIHFMTELEHWVG